MLRDGQFLREPPITIGAHHARFQPRQDFTQEELGLQSALLSERIKAQKRRDSWATAITIIAVVFGSQVLVALIEWLL